MNRQQRRQQIRQHQPGAERSPVHISPSPAASDNPAVAALARQMKVSERQRIITLKVLNGGRAATSAMEVAGAAHLTADMAVEIMKPTRPLACREGCAWCCYVQVAVTAPEALVVVAHLRETRSADELRAVHERIVELDNQTRGLGHVERADRQYRCALLVDDRCSVYAVRPLMCRGLASFDDAVCKLAWETDANNVPIPVHRGQRIAVSAVEKGLMDGLADASLDGRQLELTAALRIAIETPDAAEHWLAGEPIFEAAALSGKLV